MPNALRWLLRLLPLNPIAIRLVQGGSRRTRHFYIRTAYLGVLIVALLYLLLYHIRGDVQSLNDMARAGAASFKYIAYVQIGLICVLAPVFMAGAIAQEANPQTWDILLATPLGATEIVLGNLFGRLFFILALLMSSLPLFAVTQYFGGVPGTSIFASYLIAACAATLVASMAVALSVSRLVGKRAVFVFYVAVVSYLVVTIAIDALTGGGTRVTFVTALNPFLALKSLLDTSGYPRAPIETPGLIGWLTSSPVTAWCVLSGGLSVVLMASSILTVRIGGIAGVGGLAGKGGTPWYRRLFGLGAAGAESRPARHVWHNPIAWREAAARNSTLPRMFARWAFVIAGFLWGIGLVLWFHGSGTSIALFRQVLLYTVVGELAVLSLIAVNMASTAVAKEREDGTLDLLLTTPIVAGGGGYLKGKLRGLITYLLPLLAVPLGTLAFAGVYVALNLADIVNRQGGVVITPPVNAMSGAAATVAFPAVLPEAILVAPLVVLPFIAFCVIVGLHWSLKSKGSLGSVVATVAAVGIVSGIVGFCAWQGGTDIPAVGPALAACSPVTAVFSLIYPESGMARSVRDSLPAARVTLVVGSAIAAAIYLAVVYGMHANMVRTFDMTVRRLAGNR